MIYPAIKAKDQCGLSDHLPCPADTSPRHPRTHHRRRALGPLPCKDGYTSDGHDATPTAATPRRSYPMSPTVNNFVHDLVAMAKAMEDLPKVQHELDKAHDDIETYAKQVQRLEMSLLERNAEIEALHSKVREAEKARDDAETMFLECDDKLSAFRRLAEGFSRDSAELVRASEPPKPEPEVTQAERPVEHFDPYANEPKPAGDWANVHHNYDPPPASWAQPNEGVSVPTPPGAEPSAGPNAAHSEAAPNTGATSTGQAVGGAEPGQSAAGESVSSPDMKETPSVSSVTNTEGAGMSDPAPAVGPLPTSPEPEKFHPGTFTRTTEWWNWYDSQSPDFRVAYVW